VRPGPASCRSAIRDLDTLDTAARLPIRVLVFSTLHDRRDADHRPILSFSPAPAGQVRYALSAPGAVVSMHWCRVVQTRPACEVLINTAAVREQIRDDKPEHPT
jgi:Tfp pilus assembly pilus retraction ATPase PilT